MNQRNRLHAFARLGVAALFMIAALQAARKHGSGYWFSYTLAGIGGLTAPDLAELLPERIADLVRVGLIWSVVVVIVLFEVLP